MQSTSVSIVPFDSTTIKFTYHSLNYIHFRNGKNAKTQVSKLSYWNEGTIYKYNNYILKPLTILHLEVNTVGLIMVPHGRNHRRKSGTFQLIHPKSRHWFVLSKPVLKPVFHKTVLQSRNPPNPCRRFY